MILRLLQSIFDELISFELLFQQRRTIWTLMQETLTRHPYIPLRIFDQFKPAIIPSCIKS
jgi:hypothetical protein